MLLHGFPQDWYEWHKVIGLISSLRKIRLEALVRHVDVQTLIEVNTMLFRILVTPEC